MFSRMAGCNMMFYENLMKICYEKLQLLLLSPEEIAKVQRRYCARLCHLSFIGFDLFDNSIDDIKIYFTVSDHSMHEWIEEISFSALKNKIGTYRHWKRFALKERDVALLQNMVSLVQDKSLSSKILMDLIDYGNLIVKYSGTSIYPFFAEGTVYNNNNPTSTKIYYSFMSIDSWDNQYGYYRKERIYECIDRIILSTSQEVCAITLKKVKLFLQTQYNATPTLFALNVDENGNKEYKFYFMLEKQNMDERLELVNLIHKIIYGYNISDDIMQILKICKVINVKPLELCVGYSPCAIKLKIYFKFQDPIDFPYYTL